MSKPSTLIDHEVVGNFLVEVHYDDDSGNSPRDWDNLGTIVAWVRNFDLTDKHYGMATNLEAFLEWAREEKPYMLPLDIQDYGSNGVKIYVEDFEPNYEFPDEYKQPDGFIYVTREKLMEEYSINDPEIAFMHAVLIKEHIIDESQPDAPRHVATSIDKVLRSEIETYQKYLNGEVYGYVVREGVVDDDGEIDPDDHSGEVVESVWGFIGESDYAMSEGRAQAEAMNEQRKVEDQRAEWMMAL